MVYKILLIILPQNVAVLLANVSKYQWKPLLSVKLSKLMWATSVAVPEFNGFQINQRHRR